MRISIVVAVSENNGIGKGNRLAWHLPEDLKHFKKITMGGTMIMGRKTFESIGKALPGRVTIVVTSQKNYNAENSIVVSSIEEAFNKSKNETEVFIIGGAQIFEQVLERTEVIYLTKVHTIIDADVFFPGLNMDEWLVEEEELHPSDEKHPYDFSFLKLVRKSTL